MDLNKLFLSFCNAIWADSLLSLHLSSLALHSWNLNELDSARRWVSEGQLMVVVVDLF